MADGINANCASLCLSVRFPKTACRHVTGQQDTNEQAAISSTPTEAMSAGPRVSLM